MTKRSTTWPNSATSVWPTKSCGFFARARCRRSTLRSGKLLLAERDAISVSPDGHGGMLAALVRSGAMADARRRGIRYLFYLQVDNPLVAIGDPEFLGYHLLARSELSSQVVAKRACATRWATW